MSKRQLMKKSEVICEGHGEPILLVSGKTRWRICCRSSVGRSIKEGMTLGGLPADLFGKICDVAITFDTGYILRSLVVECGCAADQPYIRGCCGLRPLAHWDYRNTDLIGETSSLMRPFDSLGKKSYVLHLSLSLWIRNESACVGIIHPRM